MHKDLVGFLRFYIETAPGSSKSGRVVESLDTFGSAMMQVKEHESILWQSFNITQGFS
jgi:hypothetical protein